MKNVLNTSANIAASGTYSSSIVNPEVSQHTGKAKHYRGHVISDQPFTLTILQGSDNPAHMDHENLFTSGTDSSGNYVASFDIVRYGILVQMKITNTGSSTTTLLRGFLNASE
jgi:hypothetical protein